MSPPRMRIPGGTYLITRTTHDSRCLLKPGRVVDQVLEYCVFRAARKYQMDVHWLTVESTHYHLVVTDTAGRLSEYMTWVDRHVAVCLLEHYRQTPRGQRLDAVWSPGSYNATLLVTSDAILEAIDYCATNPVKDRLVRDYRKWPGLNTRPRHWTGPARTIWRPALFFNQAGLEHAEVKAKYTAPLQLPNRNANELRQVMEARIGQKQAALLARHAGKPFLGIKAVKRMDPLDSPVSRKHRADRNPTVKAGGNTGAYQRAKRAVRAFRDAYREALALFRGGAASIFPAGTLLMRTRYNVRCRPDDFSCWCELARAPT